MALGPRGACVEADRGADRPVCACGPHQRPRRGAECGCPVPQMRWEIVSVIQPVHVERINDRIADQMVDIPVPPVMEEIVAAVEEVTRLVTQVRVQRRTASILWMCQFARFGKRPSRWW